MRKLLIIILMLAMSGYATSITQAKTTDQPDNSRELQAFCLAKAGSLHKLLLDVINTNRYLLGMIHGDTEDFVPILFAQYKMENLGIILFSALAEAERTKEVGKVSNATLMMLDQYIDFLKYDLIKAKLFEGMLINPNAFMLKSKEQLALKTAAANIEVAYGLLIHMRYRLEELR